MALDKQIIRESGLHANLLPGSGAPVELQPAMTGISTDRLQMLFREPTGIIMHAVLDIAVGAGVAGNIVFLAANEQATIDANLHWDDALNRLGIGTPTPRAQLTVYGGNSGAPAAQANTYSLIEGTTDAYLGFLSLNANTVGLVFGDAADQDDGSLKYDLSTQRMTMTVGAAETIAIETGQLIVNRGVSGGTALATADELVVEGAADAGISIMTPNGSVSRIAISTAAQSGFFSILFDIGNQIIRFDHAGLGTLFEINNAYTQLTVSGRLVGSAGGALTLESTAGTADITLNGVDVVIGINQDLRLGRPAGNSNAVDFAVYGRAIWDMFLVFEDSTGTTYYVPAGTTDPT